MFLFVKKSTLLKLKAKNVSETNISTYKKYLNMHIQFVKRMQLLYIKKKIDTNKHNIKETWPLLKLAINRQNTKSAFPSSFNINDNQVSEQSKIADEFN